MQAVTGDRYKTACLSQAFLLKAMNAVGCCGEKLQMFFTLLTPDKAYLPQEEEWGCLSGQTKNDSYQKKEEKPNLADLDEGTEMPYGPGFPMCTTRGLLPR